MMHGEANIKGIFMLKQVVHIVTILPLIYSYWNTTIPKQATADAGNATLPMDAELRGQRAIIYYGL